MTKTRSTKQALLMSVLALVMCLSMLVGSTMAWFTDSVTSTGNKIQAGTLKLDLELFNGTAYESIKESKAPIFDYDKWEPGYTDVKLLKIENEGTLALKWYAKFVSDVALTDLADVIDVYVCPSATELAMPTDRNLDGYTKVGTVRDFVNTIETTTNGVLNGLSSAYLGIALKMQETAGNEYQEQKIDAFDIQILATQATVEKDIFNDQYDKDADFTIEVKNADELANALKAGGTVKLAADITADKTIEIPAGVEVALNLNGNTLSGTAIKQQHTLINYGTLTIANGTIASVGDDGGSAINNKGTLTVVDAEINGAPFVGLDGVWYPSYAVNNTGTITITDSVITAEHGGVASTKGGVATLNNVDVTAGKNGITNAALYTASAGTITVNGGTYTNRATDQNATGASVINGGITVNAGTFNGRIENYYGTPVIKGGTFSANPTRFVKGYEVTDNGNGTWTVAPFKVSSATELVNAIANGKAAELTQDVDLGKIDLTGAINNDVVINANGHKITTTDFYGIEVTAGKNVTISNADVEMTKAGDYINYAAGFKIANGDYAGATITLENCTITMANTDWAYAVTMPASVKNLNLVINNCTLEGAVAVQCWGDNNTITITNSELICNYTTSALYTSYCVALQGDGSYNSENNTLVIDNCEFKYSGVDNFNSKIYSVADRGNGNTVTITNCTYGEKVVAE